MERADKNGKLVENKYLKKEFKFRKPGSSSKWVKKSWADLETHSSVESRLKLMQNMLALLAPRRNSCSWCPERQKNEGGLVIKDRGTAASPTSRFHATRVYSSSLDFPTKHPVPQSRRILEISRHDLPFPRIVKFDIQFCFRPVSEAASEVRDSSSGKKLESEIENPISRRN